MRYVFSGLIAVVGGSDLYQESQLKLSFVVGIVDTRHCISNQRAAVTLFTK